MSAPVEIWGVLNVTPDSFSDGGRFVALGAAIEHAERMRADGADVIDVGGASSRPAGKTYGAGAPDIAPSEEIARVAPVIDALVARGMRVSIDTARGEVADAALARGASIVNDVTMGADDALLDAVARRGAELVLMHSRGGGRVDATTTAYRDVVEDVLAELRAAIARALSRGVRAERIWIDPGVGFAKTPAQSAALIGATSRFVASGHRVLVGASRKSFIGQLAPDASGAAPAPDARLGGSLAAVTAAVLGGAHAVRVHDVAVSRQAALVALAMRPPRSASRGKETRADA
ncbi:dihydropteroate synthase [Sandaracinus amylolyticus]|uniref:Dihydropteroate synthase n=1 Tax=Sandaracinus amylolyticus TaxID=927083 RepID=A0A0F6SFV5_9BACT|nr:dihydropteroate synthase [Sandaracinus amylolyticus]AKF07604.1 Dihydropteroate synthase [Sandaracinus amylolyticus]